MKEIQSPALVFVIALLSVLAVLTAPAALAKKNPFGGSWISSQYTNGKEFLLRLKQDDHDLIGWEGKLPPEIDNVPPDLMGTVKGKSADVTVQHRRGYQAHARLRLQGQKLIWQLMESDNRSSRYFPLASTLNRSSQESPRAPFVIPVSGNNSEQPIWDILLRAESFDGPHDSQSPVSSPYFSAYEALTARGLKHDDPSLRSLLKSGSPAGRLYAASILWDLNRDDGVAAFKSLLGDNAPVLFKCSREATPTTISEIARSFVEAGFYRDFPSKKYW
jgi:hypothetical protein